jgi:hypothetical protein
VWRLGLALWGLLALPVLAQPAADTVILGGKVVTVDPSFTLAEGLAIDDGRIVAVGTSSEMRRYVGPATRVLDVGGATVIPGLIDNHFHFARAVQRWHLQARLDGVDSRAAALDILAAKAAASARGQWVMVQGGWSPQQFADQPGGFTLEELDRAAPNNPLFVQQSYSIVYANSLALRAVGLNPEDGARRDAAGLATFQPPYGAFIERIPPTSAEQFEANLTDFMRTLNGVGLTGLYSLGRGPEGESERIEARALRTDLPLRIWETLTFEATDPASAAAAVELITRSRPNTFQDDFGLFGLGEHVYVPFFDLPNQNGPWPAAVLDEYEKLATAAARRSGIPPRSRASARRCRPGCVGTDAGIGSDGARDAVAEPRHLSVSGSGPDRRRALTPGPAGTGTRLRTRAEARPTRAGGEDAFGAPAPSEPSDGARRPSRFRCQSDAKGRPSRRFRADRRFAPAARPSASRARRGPG